MVDTKPRKLVQTLSLSVMGSEVKWAGQRDYTELCSWVSSLEDSQDHAVNLNHWILKHAKTTFEQNFVKLMKNSMFSKVTGDSKSQAALQHQRSTWLTSRLSFFGPPLS